MAVNEKLTEQLFFYVLRLFITRFPLLMRRSRRINSLPCKPGERERMMRSRLSDHGLSPLMGRNRDKRKQIRVYGRELSCFELENEWVLDPGSKKTHHPPSCIAVSSRRRR